MVKYIFDVWERKSSSWAGRAMPTISWLVRFGCVTFFRRYSFFKLFFFIFSVWPSFRKDTRNYLYIVLKLILFFFISLIQLSRYISKVIVTETSCHRMVDQITMKFEICRDNTNRIDCRGGFSKKEGVSSERGGGGQQIEKLSDHVRAHLKGSELHIWKTPHTSYSFLPLNPIFSKKLNWIIFVLLSRH